MSENLIALLTLIVIPD